MIIITSNHGTFFPIKKVPCYDPACILIPYVIYNPILVPNISLPVHLKDTAPTIAVALGIKPNKLWSGQSLVHSMSSSGLGAGWIVLIVLSSVFLILVLLFLVVIVLKKKNILKLLEKKESRILLIFQLRMMWN